MVHENKEDWDFEANCIESAEAFETAIEHKDVKLTSGASALSRRREDLMDLKQPMSLSKAAIPKSAM
ncbi:unnamed protein product [Phytomonas sp. Hart1]|nr:unnamed protein product [Phytomonas sp. Hart1]|eukprot:CCW67951.1 unnamed protein product [Phytomonas sp. isolate Hart1]